MNQPLVSVCLITYNQSRYIREAIMGVLMQNVTFAWELIIADDFSTDGTREILFEFKEKYPDFIKLILRDKNVGAAQNWFELLSMPKAKYISYMEGDDYWVDPFKLQKQVDFLEKNNDYVLTHHGVRVINNEGVHLTQKIEYTKHSDIADILKNKIDIRSVSIVFRRENLRIPPWFKELIFGDHILVLFLAMQGKVKFMPEEMAVYRLNHSNTVSKVNAETWARENIKFYLLLRKDFPLVLHHAISYALTIHKLKLLSVLSMRGNVKESSQLWFDTFIQPSYWVFLPKSSYYFFRSLVNYLRK